MMNIIASRLTKWELEEQQKSSTMEQKTKKENEEKGEISVSCYQGVGLSL